MYVVHNNNKPLNHLQFVIKTQKKYFWTFLYLYYIYLSSCLSAYQTFYTRSLSLPLGHYCKRYLVFEVIYSYRNMIFNLYAHEYVKVAWQPFLFMYNNISPTFGYVSGETLDSLYHLSLNTSQDNKNCWYAKIIKGKRNLVYKYYPGFSIYHV